MNQNDLYNNIGFKQPLSHNEQKEYFLLAKQGDENAKKVILEHNLRLVTLVLHRNYNHVNEEDKKELFAVGCLELWRCIENFDITLGTHFSTYAVPSIFGSMKRFFRDNKQLHIPREISNLANSIFTLEDSGKFFSNSELTKIFQVSEEQINLAKGCNIPLLSLDQPINNHDNEKMYIHEVVADNDMVIYDNIEKMELYDELRNAVNKLSDKHKLIITLFFGLNGETYKQSEIGKILNLSQSQISNLKSDALKLLKKHLQKYIKGDYEKEFVMTKKDN